MQPNNAMDSPVMTISVAGLAVGPRVRLRVAVAGGGVATIARAAGYKGFISVRF